MAVFYAKCKKTTDGKFVGMVLPIDFSDGLQPVLVDGCLFTPTGYLIPSDRPHILILYSPNYIIEAEILNGT